MLVPILPCVSDDMSGLNQVLSDSFYLSSLSTALGFYWPLTLHSKNPAVVLF